MIVPTIVILALFHLCHGNGIIQAIFQKTEQTSEEPKLNVSTIIFNPFPDICKICRCNDPVIDCKHQGLTTGNYSWPNWKHSQILLDFNFFTHLAKFPPIPNAANLSFSHNRIKEIDEKTFEDLNSLVELNLSYNYLSTLEPGVFSGQYDIEHYRPLKYLRSLDLNHNMIKSLHRDVFMHLPNLEYLNLSHNPIKVIDEEMRMALSKIPYIKVLDLSYTGIGVLPEYILHTANYLRYLNLKGNNFTKLPENFIKDGHELVHLNLKRNPIANATESNGVDNRMKTSDGKFE